MTYPFCEIKKESLDYELDHELRKLDQKDVFGELLGYKGLTACLLTYDLPRLGLIIRLDDRCLLHDNQGVTRLGTCSRVKKLANKVYRLSHLITKD